MTTKNSMHDEGLKKTILNHLIKRLLKHYRSLLNASLT